MKTPAYKTRQYQLVSTIACFQDMLAEGPPDWERDRNSRCQREIAKASADLVALLVSKHRKRGAIIEKRCEKYRAAGLLAREVA